MLKNGDWNNTCKPDGTGGIALLTIYAIPVSIYCAKLRLVLRYKQLEWREEPPIGGYGSDEFKTIVPSGNLPAMLDGTLMLSDSEAIAEYINERYPNPPMLSDDIMLRAKQRELGRFHDTRLEPALRMLFPMVPKGKRDDEFAAMQGVNISARLDQLEKIRTQCDHPETPEISLGDCGYVATFEWIEMLADEMGFNVDWPNGIQDYRAWLQSINIVKQELSSYRLIMKGWLEQRIAQ